MAGNVLLAPKCYDFSRLLMDVSESIVGPCLAWSTGSCVAFSRDFEHTHLRAATYCPKRLGSHSLDEENKTGGNQPSPKSPCRPLGPLLCMSPVHIFSLPPSPIEPFHQSVPVVSVLLLDGEHQELVGV
jgi:hypothetical protein